MFASPWTQYYVLPRLLLLGHGSSVTMRLWRKRSSVQNLINKVTHLGLFNETTDPTATENSPFTSLFQVKCFKMAEEEDFSALPLTDRWVHKVRHQPPTLVETCG